MFNVTLRLPQLSSVSLSIALADTSFLHPGMLFTQADLDRMKQRVAAKQSPEIYEWNNLQANPTASLSYSATYYPIVYRNDAVYGRYRKY